MAVFRRYAEAFSRLPAFVLVFPALLFSAFSAGSAHAAKDTSPHSEARLVAETTSIQPGKPFTVALRVKFEPHWHAYWKNPGDSGTPIEIKWQLPKGFRAGAIQWPQPAQIVLPPLVSYGYEDEVWLPIQLTAPANLPAGKTVALKAQASWLVCKLECVPASEQVSLNLLVTAAAPTPDSRYRNSFAAARAKLPAPAAKLGYAAAAYRGKRKPDAQQNDLILQVRAPAGVALPSNSLDKIYFYAADPSTIAHAKPQIVTRTSEGLRITLSPSEYSFEPVKRLRGVLAAAPGASWDAAGKVKGLEIDVPVSASAPPKAAAVSTNAATAAGGSGAPLSMGLALLLAFGGGLLLNLMPCVFPVLSLKILNFVQQADHDRAIIRRHGLAFGAGVLVSFWALAGSLLALRAAGGGVGWGYQLQSPVFVAGLALLLFAVSLNLLGAFEIGAGLTSLGSRGAVRGGRSGGYGGSFASGVLATVVATPCTAPFMGAALGYALTQPAAAAMVVFTALGLGVAAPYVLLSLNPSWLRVLPRPGAWMETLKQVMAFPMFATALWLAWVFGLQTGVNGLILLLAGFLLFGFAVWLLGRWKGDISRRVWTATRLLAATAFALAVLAAWRGSAEVPADTAIASAGDSASAAAKVAWQPFSASKVAELRAAGKPVFVDFTAAWCLTCQVNKKVTLARQDVLDAFAKRGVTLMRADWTRRDPEISRVLEGLGRSGVPVYALYEPTGKDGEETPPRLLPEVLSEPVVLDALKELPETGAPDEAPSRQALRPATSSALPVQ